MSFLIPDRIGISLIPIMPMYIVYFRSDEYEGAMEKSKEMAMDIVGIVVPFTCPYGVLSGDIFMHHLYLSAVRSNDRNF